MKVQKRRATKSSGLKAPIIKGLNKQELRMWLAFCKSVNSNI